MIKISRVLTAVLIATSAAMAPLSANAFWGWGPWDGWGGPWSGDRGAAIRTTVAIHIMVVTRHMDRGMVMHPMATTPTMALPIYLQFHSSLLQLNPRTRKNSPRSNTI